MLELALQLLPFAVSMSVTPGPNNVMLAASGANFGFRRTLPHLSGVAIGFPVMVLALGLGAGSLFQRYPAAHQAMKWIGFAYLLYLAYRIATTRRMGEGGSTGRPLSFVQAALFQWVNAKAWIMAVGAVSTYTTVGGDPVAETVVIALVFAIVATPSCAVWTLFGLGIRRFLQSPRAFAAFNVAMALLLVLSLLPSLV